MLVQCAIIPWIITSPTFIHTHPRFRYILICLKLPRTVKIEVEVNVLKYLINQYCVVDQAYWINCVSLILTLIFTQNVYLSYMPNIYMADRLVEDKH